MAGIAVLSQHLVNKIAAGEVIERPASVVKELLENALDAGATRVHIEVEDGGKKLIRITDDGSGMGVEDLPLSVTPHATSKIASDDDLFSIHTFGFRGEALASIASVSQMEIISRPGDSNEGSRLVIEGGLAEPIMPAAAAPGTTISVRHLFFNTPARRKFLRTTNTEMGHISEQFSRVAMANINVHLTLSHNGRILYDLPAGQPLHERVGRLFSPELSDSLIPIHRADRGIEITGLIAPPQQNRAGVQWQYILLNGRYIRDRFVGHAIKEAYRGLMEINRSPIAFLFISVPPDQVDVNVHPTKIEVRFADSNVVHSQVLAAIRDKLLGSDLRVPVKVENKPEAESPTASTEDEQSRQQSVRQAMVNFFKKAEPPSTTPASEYRYTSDSGFAKQSTPGSEFVGTDTTDTQAGDGKIPTADQEVTLESDSGESTRQPERFIQIHNSYLVAESGDGVVIIDQHALHERLIFQQLIEQAAKGPLECQRCLIPETLEVTDAQMAILEGSQELLEKLGVIAEPFGPRTIAIQGFPMLLEKLTPVGFVRDLLDLLAEQAGKVSEEQMVHKVLDMMSCKAAVKAGDRLTDVEIQSLLAQREVVERSSNCPHGRPTTIHLSLSQLEKQFKRT